MANLSPALEIHLRRDGGVVHLVSRYRPRGLLLVIALLAMLASGSGIVCQSRQQSFRLECSRRSGSCVLADRDLTLERFPLSVALRFEVRRRSGVRDGWALVAVTTERDVSLVGGLRRPLEAAAAELNRFLEDPSQPEHVFEDVRSRLRAAAVPVLLVMNAVLLVALLFMAIDRETVFDRLRGLAIRRLTLFPSRRRLRDFRAVQVRSLADEARVRLVRSIQYERRRIVLVAEDGSSWWVTPYQPPRGARTDLDAVAAELARYLGLPLETSTPNGTRTASGTHDGRPGSPT